MITIKSVSKAMSLMAALALLMPAHQIFGQGKDKLAGASKPDAATQKLIARLESRIPALMSAGDVPGLSIAFIKDSKTVWSRGFGYKNAETKEPVDDLTMFGAASLSKPVFAYAVLKM